MKAIKFLFFGLAGLVVLALIGVGAALMIVDGQFVKTRLERAMKEKNRTLKIEGTPQLKLFPVAGISLGKTTLSEPGSDKLFVSLDSAEVAVRVMPLAVARGGGRNPEAVRPEGERRAAQGRLDEFLGPCRPGGKGQEVRSAAQCAHRRGAGGEDRR